MSFVSPNDSFLHQQAQRNEAELDLSTSSNADNEPEQHPEALRSPLVDVFPTTVVGTAIIGKEFLFSDDMFELFEIVDPPLDELQTTSAVHEFLVEDAVRRKEITAGDELQTENLSFSRHSRCHAASGDSDKQKSGNHSRKEHTIHSALAKMREITRLAVSKLEELDKKTSKPEAPPPPPLTVDDVVRAGGYILFSNRYVTANPHSHIAGLTKAYRLAKPPPPIEIDTTLPPEKQRTQQLVAFIREATEQSRPLFRMRAAASVYGESEYVPSDDAEALVELQVRTYLESETLSAPATPNVVPLSASPSQFYSSLRSFHLGRSFGSSASHPLSPRQHPSSAPSVTLAATQLDT